MQVIIIIKKKWIPLDGYSCGYFLIVAVASGVAGLVVACQDSEGEQGETGPKGDKGDTGPQGAQGNAGLPAITTKKVTFDLNTIDTAVFGGQTPAVPNPDGSNVGWYYKKQDLTSKINWYMNPVAGVPVSAIRDVQFKVKWPLTSTELNGNNQFYVQIYTQASQPPGAMLPPRAWYNSRKTYFTLDGVTKSDQVFTVHVREPWEVTQYGPVASSLTFDENDFTNTFQWNQNVNLSPTNNFEVKDFGFNEKLLGIVFNTASGADVGTELILYEFSFVSVDTRYVIELVG